MGAGRRVLLLLSSTTNSQLVSILSSRTGRPQASSSHGDALFYFITIDEGLSFQCIIDHRVEAAPAIIYLPARMATVVYLTY